jgi:hypothetical protein
MVKGMSNLSLSVKGGSPDKTIVRTNREQFVP